MSPSKLAKQIVDSILATGLAPTLTAEGFKRSARRFVRRKGLVEQGIWLELSSWNRGSDGSFSVWVGLRFDEMDAVAGYDFACPIHAVTPLAPHTFYVSAETPLQEAADALCRIVMVGIVAPLNAVGSLSDFETTGWAAASPWSFPTRMAYHLGNDAEAARRVADEAAFFADRGVTEAELIERYRLHRLCR